ncbi:MAG TPA: hypothetical protein VE982_05740 [Gaiellaceae bacterium]|nr:hypothetical protein [Gaiellaceae bacterium]
MADLELVDALARLQLAARRCGYELAITDAPVDLLELIELAGLCEALRVEARRQPEEREQRLGVEEEGELDDAAA